MILRETKNLIRVFLAESLMVDFEQAMLKAFVRDIPIAQLNGRFSHFTQYKWRKFQACNID